MRMPDWISKLALRFGAFALFALLLNALYTQFLFKGDLQRYSPVKSHIDSAFAEADIVYLGESSNTSFNPWTDTLTESIADFMQLHLDAQLSGGAKLKGAPGSRIRAVTHASYHPGLFRQMLNLRGERKPLIVVTVNLRTCGPSAEFSGNEASNQQEALFYSTRPALLTRAYLSLHHYDNRSAAEMERLKRQYWRTRELNQGQCEAPFLTTRDWLDNLAASHYELDSKVRNMADAYVKEFAFLLDENSARIKDLKAIVEECEKAGLPLLFHLLPPNYAHAEALFGGPSDPGNLVQFIDRNREFLLQQFENWGVRCIDNSQLGRGVENQGHHYTDQWYPTEHYDAGIRQAIGQSLALALVEKGSDSLFMRPAARNRPNPHISMPLADTLLNQWRSARGLGFSSLAPMRVLELKEVASASGLEYWEGHYWLVGDNAPYLFEFDTAWQFVARYPLHSQSDMPDSLYPGKSKPDWESLGIRDGWIWILGSGSKPDKRDYFLIWNQGAVQAKGSLTHVYQELFGEFEKRKITNNEGLVFGSGCVLLANRENNQITLMPEAQWDAVLAGKPLERARALEVQLPSLQGQEASLSGLYIDEQERLWFTASVELREESTLDGGIAGSFLGYLAPQVWKQALPRADDPKGLLHDLELSPTQVWLAQGQPWKMESIVVIGRRAFCVTDSDGGPSEMLEFLIP
ncbi:MAG: hypothetical protein O3C22_02095 [Bacteroidetes bacterium]|nr:hypothetical protein [Bacteroidota bacterium]MDA1110999.1 hypothetical protein [Bacteroidota bacterium]